MYIQKKNYLYQEFKTNIMGRTKQMAEELSEKMDYLEQYYHELVDSETPSTVRKDILDKVLSI